jgi:hypothetical protein
MMDNATRLWVWKNADLIRVLMIAEQKNQLLYTATQELLFRVIDGRPAQPSPAPTEKPGKILKFRGNNV